MANEPLKIYSQNIHGFNASSKTSKVLHHLWTNRIDIACLQETSSPLPPHLGSSPCITLNFYLASAPEKHCGILIAFHHNLVFSCFKEIADPNGRYLILVGNPNGQEVTLANYYAPNRFQDTFFSHLLRVINQHSKGIVLLGDSNVALDSAADWRYVSHVPPSHSSSLEAHMGMLFQSHGLVDAWRELHPRGRDFPF